MRLDELATKIEATLAGEGSLEITDVAALDDARPGQVSFLAQAKYRHQLETTGASAVIVPPNIDSPRVALLKSKEPAVAFSKAVIILRGPRKHPHSGVHPQARIDPSATIGENTVIYPGVFVGPRVKIGRDCVVYPNVTIYEDCVIGDRVIVHANTTIGVDGFGFATSGGVHHNIPQIGNVIIEDDVEVGANCTIARAALASTVIGAGTKIDSQVMIAHNVKMGRGCLIIAQAGLAGSVTLGDYVTIAGQVGVAGHLMLGDKAIVAAKSGVMSDVEAGAIVMGVPAMPAGDARRVYGAFVKLPELMQRIKELEQQVQELTDSGDTPIA